MAKSTPEQDRVVLMVFAVIACFALMILTNKAANQHQQDVFTQFLEQHQVAPMSDRIASLHCINGELHVLLDIKNYRLHKASPVVNCTAAQIEATTEESKGWLWYFPMIMAFVLMVSIMAWGSFAMVRHVKTQHKGATRHDQT